VAYVSLDAKINFCRGRARPARFLDNRGTPLLIRCALSLLLCAALAFGQRPRSQTAAYQIAGKVVDAQSGAALAGAEVMIALVSDRQQAESVVAGPDGAFQFPDLPAGKYALTATHRGYLTQSFHEHGGYSTAVVTGPGLESTGLAFPLSRPAAISGSVIDQDNEPVPYAHVFLFKQEIVNGIRTARPIPQDSSSDDGRFHVSGLAPGTYYLALAARPWYTRFIQRRSSVADTPDSEKLDVAYPVMFYPNTPVAESAAPITLQPGAQMQADFVVTAVPAAHLKTERPGQPTQTRLEIPTPWGGAISDGTSFFDPGGDAYSVAPGRYDVNATWRDATGTHSLDRVMDIQGDMTIDFKSEDALNLSGTVTGAPLPTSGAIVLIDSATGTMSAARHTGKGQLSWGGGQLRGGKYEIGLTQAPGYYIDHISATGAKSAGRTVELPASGTVALTISIGAGAATLNGKVEHGGKPFAGAMVLLLPQDIQYSPGLTRRDQSDSDGTFTLPDVVPGRYTLVAIDGGEELEYSNPTAIQPYLAHGQVLNIARGGKYDVTANLIATPPSPAAQVSSTAAVN
jgi:hypothetical protein